MKRKHPPAIDPELARHLRLQAKADKREKKDRARKLRAMDAPAALRELMGPIFGAASLSEDEALRVLAIVVTSSRVRPLNEVEMKQARALQRTINRLGRANGNIPINYLRAGGASDLHVSCGEALLALQRNAGLDGYDMLQDAGPARSAGTFLIPLVGSSAPVPFLRVRDMTKPSQAVPYVVAVAVARADISPESGQNMARMTTTLRRMGHLSGSNKGRSVLKAVREKREQIRRVVLPWGTYLTPDANQVRVDDTRWRADLQAEGAAIRAAIGTFVRLRIPS